MFAKIINKFIFPSLKISLIVFASTFLLWLPFIFHCQSWFGLKIINSNFQYIYKNYDGPLYIVPAKTFYHPKLIDKIGIELPLSEKYFAAHFPFYPLLIRLFSSITGYLKSMILVNFLATLCLALCFYFIVVDLKISKKPILLTIIFLFLPRFLILRSIGAPESLFMGLIILSLYFFEKKKYFLSGVGGYLASVTKSPGILLFVVYLLILAKKYLKIKKINRQSLFVFLIPFGLLSVFLLYWHQYGDFFAYFHSGNNIHLVFPFSVFNFQKEWVGTGWLEDIIFYFFIYLITVLSLKNKPYQSFFYFSLVFFLAIIFVQHRDISRYSLPLWPLACIAGEEFLTSKKFLIAFFLLLPAIYLYAWNFIIYNIMPISNWQPFL